MTPATHADAAPAEAWRGFAGRRWRASIDVRDFIMRRPRHRR